ncbi:MAG: DUF2723 domain-containing protein [Polyangiales bacterium]
MADESTPSRDAPPDAIAWLSALVPAVAAALLAGASMGHLDAPELATAAAGLGVTHPPGHPLWVLLHGVACALVPIGPVAFRVALASALWLAIVGRCALSLAWSATAPVDDEAEPLSVRWRSTLSLGAALLASLSVGLVRQATRSEVYALAAMLAIAPIAVITTSSLGEKARARVAVAIALLGLANHHFIALTAMPALGVLLAPIVRKNKAHLISWVPPLLSATALYAALPLRASAQASIVRPRSIGELIEVASARTFAKNTGSGVPDGAAVRVADVLDLLADSLSSAGILAGLVGLAFAFRKRSALERQRWALFAMVALPYAARAWLGFSRDNPDAAGYLAPAIITLAVLSAHGTSTALRTIRAADRTPQKPSAPVRALLVAVLVLAPSVAIPLWALSNSIDRTQTDRTQSSTTLALSAIASAPARAVLMAHGPNTIFRLRYAQYVEGERPDVTVVPVPLLGYPGMVSSLIAREPALAPVFTRYLLQPGTSIAAREATGLATQRPVMIELHPDNVEEYVRFVLPSGPFATVLEAPTTLADVRAGAARHFARFDQLATQLGTEPASKRESDEVLLWMAFNDALFFAGRGARPEARRSIERALERAPNESRLHALRAAIDGTPGDGPIPLSAILPR